MTNYYVIGLATRILAPKHSRVAHTRVFVVKADTPEDAARQILERDRDIKQVIVAVTTRAYERHPGLIEVPINDA